MDVEGVVATGSRPKIAAEAVQSELRIQNGLSVHGDRMKAADSDVESAVVCGIR